MWPWSAARRVATTTWSNKRRRVCRTLKRCEKVHKPYFFFLYRCLNRDIERVANACPRRLGPIRNQINRKKPHFLQRQTMSSLSQSSSRSSLFSTNSSGRQTSTAGSKGCWRHWRRSCRTRSTTTTTLTTKKLNFWKKVISITSVGSTVGIGTLSLTLGTLSACALVAFEDGAVEDEEVLEGEEETLLVLMTWRVWAKVASTAVKGASMQSVELNKNSILISFHQKLLTL